MRRVRKKSAPAASAAVVVAVAATVVAAAAVAVAATAAVVVVAAVAVASATKPSRVRPEDSQIPFGGRLHGLPLFFTCSMGVGKIFLPPFSGGAVRVKGSARARLAFGSGRRA